MKKNIPRMWTMSDKVAHVFIHTISTNFFFLPKKLQAKTKIFHENRRCNLCQ